MNKNIIIDNNKDNGKQLLSNFKQLLSNFKQLLSNFRQLLSNFPSLFLVAKRIFSHLNIIYNIETYKMMK